MTRMIRLYVSGVIVLFIFFITACGKEPSGLLAKIGDRDSITVAEFQELFRDKLEKNARTVNNDSKKKFLVELINRHIKLLKAHDEGIQDSPEFLVILEKAKKSKIIESALDRYVYGHFITDASIQDYRRNLKRQALVQNLVIFYRSDSNPESRRTKKEAIHLIDSLHKIIDHRNFDRIAEKYSDDIDPLTNKGRIAVEYLSFGDLPYNYENQVFNSLPNTLTKPMDGTTAMILSRVVGFVDAVDSTKVQISDKDIRGMMKRRFQSSDQSIYLAYFQNFMDSLVQSANIRFNENNLRMLLSRSTENSTRDDALGLFSETEQLMELASYSVQKTITIFDVLNSFGAENAMPTLTDMRMLKDIVTSQVRLALLEQKIAGSGYLESQEFKRHWQLYSERLLVRMIDAKIFYSPDSFQESELRQFYGNNFGDYFSPGSIVVKEIFSRSASAISDVSKLLDGGMDIEPAFQRVRSLYRDTKDGQVLQYRPNVSYSYSDKNGMARSAMRLEVNEFSDVLPGRDGGYSIIKVLRKQAPQPAVFESIRQKVEIDYRRYQSESQMRKWLSQEREKYQIVIFEHNLNNVP